MLSGPTNKTDIAGKPVVGVILLLLAAIAVLHYTDILPYARFLDDIMGKVGLTRYSLERILLLIPIIISGLSLGWKASSAASLTALIIMLPNSIMFHDDSYQSVFETCVIFILGIILTIYYRSRSTELEKAHMLEITGLELKESEDKYRKLFENVPDAIFIHDRYGEIIAANAAAGVLSGYSKEELLNSKINNLFSEESWFIVEAVEQLLSSGESSDWATEINLLRKNRSQAYVRLTIRIIRNGEENTIFQCSARDISEQKRMQENLHYYLQQATRAQEEERKRIALELHDETIQELVVLSRQLDLLASKGKDELSPDNASLLKDLRQQTKNIMQSLRNISQDLRPATLDRLGLLPALGFLANEMTRYSGIETRVNTTGIERRLPEEEELVLFRITQEALRNVTRHSKAKKAEINLEFSEQKIKVSIADDGRGFYPPENINDLSKDGKLGLIGMLERTKLINGHISIQSEPGKGTLVMVEALI